MFILTDRSRYLVKAFGYGEWTSTATPDRAKTFPTVAKANKFLEKNQLNGVLVAVAMPVAVAN